MAGLVFAAGMASTKPSYAWYFPEHTELTRLALQDFAPRFATEELTRLIEQARRGVAGAPGVPAYKKLCAGPTMRLGAVLELSEGPCVPYGALAALAADHSNVAMDDRKEKYGLSALLLTKFLAPLAPPVWRSFPETRVREEAAKAVLLTEAASDNWVAFLSKAPREVVETWTVDVSRLDEPVFVSSKSVNPRDYVRALDSALLVIDPGYVSRAKGAKTHFHDATTSTLTILQQASLGDLDNALAQLVAHHLRSLQLAARARSATGAQRVKLRNEALFEHAFALHFIQDGLAAGHVATAASVTVDEHRAQRHDYFNRQGLAVRRALGNRPCDLFERPTQERSMGLSPCWVAHGDGFAARQDRTYVAEASARVQTSFALALKGSVPWTDASIAHDCAEWLVDDGKPEISCDLAWTAFLLDPFPEWTMNDAKWPEKKAWATGVVHRHLAAIEALGRLSPLRAADAGTPSAQPGTVPPIFGRVLSDEEPATGAPPNDTLAELGVALVRPLLVAWPAAQADVSSLEGGDIFHRGFQLQVAVNAALGYAHPFSTDATTALWFGLGGGVGYAAQGIFPFRVNRTLFEANVGFAEGYYLAGSDVSFRSLGVAEVRIPVSSMAVYGLAFMFRSRMPLELLGDRFSWGLLGARAYASLDLAPVEFVGWDAEVANLYLGTPGSGDAAASGLTSQELRLRLGWRSEDFTRMTNLFEGAFFIAVELSSGYYTTVL